MGSLIRFLSLAAAVCLAASAAAQQSGTLQVERRFTTAAGVRDDSRRFFPQIDESVSPHADRPENPVPPIALGSGDSSPLVPGLTSNVNRNHRRAAFPGIGATGWIPPDPNLAVGPNHIVEVVNTSLAWFDKTTGVKQFQQVMEGSNGFFNTVGAGNFVFDPKCTYDPISKRFIVLGLDVVFTSGAEDSFFVIAVSDDSNPNGVWFKYRINNKLKIGDDTFWMDYPSLATNKDGIAMCGNMFGLVGASGWAGVEFVTMKKAPMLLGQPTVVTILRDATGASAQVSRSVDAAVDTIYGMCFSSTSSMRLYALRNLALNPTVTFQNVTIPTFRPPAKNATSTGGVQLDSIDSRAFNSAYRAGKVYATHNVSVSPSNAQLQARWYQVRTNGWPTTGTPALEMAGDVRGANGVDHWMPAIGVNSLGDVSLIFSRASSSITADLMITSRKANDPAGVMGLPIKLEGSLANYQSGSRWGDYFDVAVDPADNVKFWGVGMIGDQSGAWQTVIHSWQVSSPIEAATSYDALFAAMYNGVSYTGTTPDVHAIDGSLFTINSQFVSQMGGLAAAECTFDLGDPPLPPSLIIGLRIKATTTTRTSGLWWLKNYRTGNYDFISAFPLNTTMGTPVTVSTTRNLSDYRSPSGEVRAILRSTTRPNNSIPYQLKVDQMQLLVAPVP